MFTALALSTHQNVGARLAMPKQVGQNDRPTLQGFLRWCEIPISQPAPWESLPTSFCHAKESRHGKGFPSKRVREGILAPAAKGFSHQPLFAAQEKKDTGTDSRQSECEKGFSHEPGFLSRTSRHDTSYKPLILG